MNNIPDMVPTRKCAYVVDFAVSLPSNIIKTYNEEINKYLPLRDEILQMWNLDEVKIVP